MKDARSSDAADDLPENLSGHLLLAHPGIEDPHFFRSVVLLSAHERESGAVGVVVTHPLGVALGARDAQFALGPLGGVPLFQGGPVQPDHLLFVAWHWQEDDGLFELYFDTGAQRAQELLEENPQMQVCAFLGYAGWSAGQLEEEINAGGWAVLPVYDNRLSAVAPQGLWRSCAADIAPEWLLATDCPDDASLN